MAVLRDVPAAPNAHAATRLLTHGTGSATSDDSEAHRAYDLRYPPRPLVPHDLPCGAYQIAGYDSPGRHIHDNRDDWRFRSRPTRATEWLTLR
jgi:hypothetical protein